jgi:type IV secretion system protein VirD4
MISSEIAMMGAGALALADLRYRLGLSWWLMGAVVRVVSVGRCLLVRSWKFAAWKLRAAPVTFGAARWMREGEAAAWGLLGAGGLIVGKLGRRVLRFADVEGSVVVFAPQGAGKGVGIVVPNLLTYPGSVICTDPKGENFAITARARRAFGPVYCVNVGDVSQSHRFNPMDALSRDALKVVDDCRRLAELLMPKESRDEDNHWRMRSVSILTGFLLHVLEEHGSDAERCNLGTVDALLAAPLAELADTLKRMLASPQMVVRSVAARLQTSLDSEEGRNLLSNLTKGTEIWSEGGGLGRIARSSDFSLERDVVGRVATLFVSVPEDMKAVYAPFMRVMVGLSLHAVARVGKQGVGIERPLFMLDEAAALGHIPELEDGMGHLRAYARAVLIFQDLGQLQGTYRKWRSLLANAACQVFFGVNDQDTAELVSKMVGDTTVEAPTFGVNTGAGTVLAHHENVGIGQAGRRLVQASDVLRMGKDTAVVFVRDAPQPILAGRLRYYEEAMFKGLWDRWREGAAVPKPLMLEHKPLRLEVKPLQIEHLPLRLEGKRAE